MNRVPSAAFGRRDALFRHGDQRTAAARARRARRSRLRPARRPRRHRSMRVVPTWRDWLRWPLVGRGGRRRRRDRGSRTSSGEDFRDSERFAGRDRRVRRQARRPTRSSEACCLGGERLRRRRARGHGAARPHRRSRLCCRPRSPCSALATVVLTVMTGDAGAQAVWTGHARAQVSPGQYPAYSSGAASSRRNDVDPLGVDGAVGHGVVEAALGLVGRRGCNRAGSPRSSRPGRGTPR